ncbi:hypothetical protein A3I40_04130 [Candidatus Uhrbacteria bacterium RIFCSPLOWO2_02_FULL_48_12]|uniref:Rod shape-determining protein MreD n=1 Tax=Candidatus Uhrbacteria bacterium RIFCSPLOWO2_02_FULL_48_12 TaxID=1802407 RepID=A0A1F7V8Q7_9BACT|nr:MAG: hypothetical protein A3I40_04130 [Candidatus Uhrbacteria bacterium RIFCSPLOWO2_02_FULL_48_12]
MTKHWTIFLIILLFMEPMADTVMPALLPEILRGTSLFPAFVIIMFLFLPQPWIPIVIMVGAMWRDIILLAHLAPTFLGAGLALVILVLLKQFLTNRSLMTDGLTVLLAYGGYVLGEALSLWLAKLLGLSDEPQRLFMVGALAANFVFIIVFILIWRLYHPDEVSHNFY